MLPGLISLRSAIIRSVRYVTFTHYLKLDKHTQIA